ncbi:MAG: prephenate dehydratase [Sphingomonadales bacterium]
MTVETNVKNKIAFQGALGAYSNIACEEAYPGWTPVPCVTFEDAFAKVEKGETDRAMIPIENSQAGRVADIHFILPESDLTIVGEHFLRVRHCLLGTEKSQLADIETVLSHPQALGQCRKYLNSQGITPVAHGDTADAARVVARRAEISRGAIASRLAATTYGLNILAEDIEDAGHNTTRFVVLAKTPLDPDPADGPIMTTIMFEVRNVPAALYKALGGLATNRVNMTKLESYLTDVSFNATQFFADIEGHPNDPQVARALEELDFHTKWVRVFGSYTRQRMRVASDGER